MEAADAALLFVMAAESQALLSQAMIGRGSGLLLFWGCCYFRVVAILGLLLFWGCYLGLLLFWGCYFRLVLFWGCCYFEVRGP